MYCLHVKTCIIGVLPVHHSCIIRVLPVAVLCLLPLPCTRVLMWCRVAVRRGESMMCKATKHTKQRQVVTAAGQVYDKDSYDYATNLLLLVSAPPCSGC